MDKEEYKRLLLCDDSGTIKKKAAKKGANVMALSTLTARVDEHDKIEFDSFCSSVGLTSSAAINIYVKAVLRERTIPFDIKQEDPFFDPVNLAYVVKSVKELREGKGTVHELIEDGDE